MNNIVITIGREYGSGGKYIGMKVASKLSIEFYDDELLQKTYENNNCIYSKLEEYDEVKRSNMFNLGFFVSDNYDETFEYEKYQVLVSDTIRNLADTTSCVIIGRNANNILKGRSNVINIFIYSKDLDFKVKRKMELDNLSYEDCLERLKQIDKRRKKYYESVNKGKAWGAKDDFDFLIDSSILGVDGTVDLIVDIYNKYKNS